MEIKHINFPLYVHMGSNFTSKESDKVTILGHDGLCQVPFNPFPKLWTKYSLLLEQRTQLSRIWDTHFEFSVFSCNWDLPV